MKKKIWVLGSAFDINSLGCWIYNWTAFIHEPDTPIAKMAHELWIALLHFAGEFKMLERMR